jgi:hypothetical protein
MLWFLEFFNLVETIVPFYGQTYVKNHLWAKAFPTSANLWRSVAWNLDFHADNGKASKWKIFIPRLKPVKDIKGLIIKTNNHFIIVIVLIVIVIVL